MVRRVASALVVLAALGAAPLRERLETPAAPEACEPQGRGASPRHFLGCAADPGDPRPLEPDERLALGLPIDPNRASERELALVPGLTRRLAAEVVADRRERGPFPDVDALLRVRGIGPRRLAQARRALAVEP